MANKKENTTCEWNDDGRNKQLYFIGRQLVEE
jgi:hypothetical protein